MKDFVILPDVCCDLSPKLRERFSLDDYVRAHFSINGGRDNAASLDWSHISMRDFYSMVNDSRKHFVTAPLSPAEYCKAFEKYAAEGRKVLSMSVTSIASEMYLNSLEGRRLLLEKYPDADIRCFDSLRMSGGFGLLVIYAAEMREKGASIDEVLCWLEENKRRVHQMGPIDSVSLLSKRGRISLGGTVRLPQGGMHMGDCNNRGFVTVLGSAESMESALSATVSYMERTITEPEKNYVLITHTDRFSDALRLKTMIEERIRVKEILISDVFPGVGSNVGGAMVGAYYLGSRLSDNVIKERALLNDILG